HLDGFGALPQGLRLVLGLLEAHWDTLHPLPDPDDGDPYARMNALAVLAESDGVLGDLRQAVLIQQRGVGEVRVRSVEIALDMVCAYLERAEPTNPAPLLLRRARRLISHNFLQLMKELAPDALDQVARVMGVDPSTVQIDDAS